MPPAPPSASPDDDFGSQGRDPIAIVGMACRFPGAHDLDAFWRLIRDGRDAIREVPPSRWDIGAVYDPDPAAPGKMYTRWGGFLDDLDKFDARFFSIAPREASQMDPQQRLLLEVTWEALEHAGLAPERLAGSRAGVFMGVATSDYLQRQLHEFAGHLDRVNPYTGTGGAPSIAANRISYVLDLKGPSLAVDTACSSSLVAVHLACQSLRNRESVVALAGGVNVILNPQITIGLCRARVMAPDGRCKTFDARADGYVRAEGCAVVVLKRLSDAVRDRDAVLAVILGSAVNQDGRTAGIMFPSGLAQQNVVHRALEVAGLEPDALSYVETHGTGTLGDAIEVEALATVLGPGAGDVPPCHLGSIKANVGHMEAAAGVGGLVKTVLCMAHEEIPPQANFATLHPGIDLAGTRFRIATRCEPWEAGAVPRAAGVSSFGFGGTNAHVVLREAPPMPAEAQAGVDRPLHVLALSARSEQARREIARRFGAHLAHRPRSSVADVCYTAATGRAQLPLRLAVLGASTVDLRERLDAFVRGAHCEDLVVGRADRIPPRIAFLCDGEAAHRDGMERRLYETLPGFRRALDRWAARVPRTPAGPFHPSRPDRRLPAAVALLLIECALVELLATWGVRADAVLGHDVGEYAAACVSGALTVEEACHRLATSTAPHTRATGDLAADMTAQSIGLCIAIGSGTTLSSTGTTPTFPLLAAGGGDDWRTLLGTVMQLWVRGVCIDWVAFDADHARRRVPLPMYPFDRASHWYAPVGAPALRSA